MRNLIGKIAFSLVALFSSACLGQNTLHQDAILIGFGEYESLPDITTQSSEIKQLANVLKTSCGFSEITIIDQPENFSKQIQNAIAKAVNRRSKRVLIYISGYVYANDEGQLILAVPKTDPDRPADAGEQLAGIVDAINKLAPSTSVTILSDCCRSATVEVEPIGLSNDLIVSAFENSRNAIAIAASIEGQQSHLIPKGKGIFVTAVLQSLAGTADSSGDGKITASEFLEKLFDDVQTTGAAHGIDQSPELFVYGNANESQVITSCKKLVPTKSFMLTNKATSSNSTLYIRHTGKTFKLAAKGSTVVEVGRVSDIEFFQGKVDGQDVWRTLEPAPGNHYEFRTARQTDGNQGWTAGFTNRFGIQMTLIPSGTFWMGANQNDGQDADESELPRHEVTITRPFFLGSHEVTIAQFKSFVASTGYKTVAEEAGYENTVITGGNGDFGKQQGLSWSNPGPGLAQSEDQPAVHITWNDATKFCTALRLKENAKYKLPTEAQWEYAARAGTQTKFWNGNDPQMLPTIANVRDASLKQSFPSYQETLPRRDGFAYTSPASRFSANPFGIHDMHGNVWEWCSDVYSDDYYRDSPQINPAGPQQGQQGYAYRGGCFY